MKAHPTTRLAQTRSNAGFLQYEGRKGKKAVWCDFITFKNEDSSGMAWESTCKALKSEVTVSNSSRKESSMLYLIVGKTIDCSFCTASNLRASWKLLRKLQNKLVNMNAYYCKLIYIDLRTNYFM